MAGFIVVKVRCSTCLKRVATGGAEACQCKDPKPERMEMRVLTPRPRPHVQSLEVAVCAS